MAGIDTRTRLEQLQALHRRTKHDRQSALLRGDTHLHRKLCLLEQRLEQEIAAILPPPPRTDRARDLLAQLGVTSNDVKRWAVTQGLLDTVKRGRIRVDLVELYAATHRRDHTA